MDPSCETYFSFYISEELFVPVPKVDVSFCDIRFPNLECWAAGEGGEAGGQRKPV